MNNVLIDCLSHHVRYKWCFLKYESDQVTLTGFIWVDVFMFILLIIHFNVADSGNTRERLY